MFEHRLYKFDSECDLDATTLEDPWSSLRYPCLGLMTMLYTELFNRLVIKEKKPKFTRRPWISCDQPYHLPGTNTKTHSTVSTEGNHDCNWYQCCALKDVPNGNDVVTEVNGSSNYTIPNASAAWKTYCTVGRWPRLRYAVRTLNRRWVQMRGRNVPRKDNKKATKIYRRIDRMWNWPDCDHCRLSTRTDSVKREGKMYRSWDNIDAWWNVCAEMDPQLVRYLRQEDWMYRPGTRRRRFAALRIRWRELWLQFGPQSNRER
jgi:hypothetical protein